MIGWDYTGTQTLHSRSTMHTPSHPPSRIAAAFLLAATLFAAPAIRAQAIDQLHTATRLELDIVKVLIAQQNAWNDGDLTTYLAAYKNSPDTLFVGGQVLRGYTELVYDYRKNYPNKESMGTLTFSEPEVHPLGDNFAICLGKYRLERSRKAGGPAEGLFSLVFEKTPQGWKIVLDHTT